MRQMRFTRRAAAAGTFAASSGSGHAGRHRPWRSVSPFLLLRRDVPLELQDRGAGGGPTGAASFVIAGGSIWSGQSAGQEVPAVSARAVRMPVGLRLSRISEGDLQLVRLGRQGKANPGKRGGVHVPTGEALRHLWHRRRGRVRAGLSFARCGLIPSHLWARPVLIVKMPDRHRSIARSGNGAS